MLVANNQLQTYWATHKKLVELYLDQLLSQSSDKHNLYLAMRHGVLNGGKRLRPMLTFIVGELFGIKAELLLPVAASVELVHCYSLVHDDLPAMDDDDLRRGVPTCHKMYDEATAILAGDALQGLAFELLASDEAAIFGSEAQIKMVRVLARAIGASGMVLGQALDMRAEGQVLSLTDLNDLHGHKTGDLLTASIEVGLIAATPQRVSMQDYQALLVYGRYLGLAFQVQDDILDVTSDDATLGKPVGSDEKSNKATYVSMVGLEEAQRLAQKLTELAVQQIGAFGEKGKLLRELAEYVIKRVS